MIITTEMIEEARIAGISVDSFDESIHEWITKSYTDYILVDGEPITDENGNQVIDENGNPIYIKVRQEVTLYKIIGYQMITAPEVSLPTFNVITPNITVGGQSITPVNGLYYVQQGVPITITTTATLENGDAISLPPPLALPIVMFDASGNPTVKKYGATTVENGLVTCNVTLNEGGNWRITQQFVNESLLEVGQQWQVSMPTFNFVVM